MEVKFTIRVNVDLERDIVEAAVDPIAETSDIHLIVALAALCDAAKLPAGSRRVAASVIMNGLADDDDFSEAIPGGDADG